jgi:hypothetical protein
MMKTWVVSFLLGVGCVAIAAPRPVELVYDESAVIHTCPPRHLGCAPSIDIGGENYLLEALAASRASLNDLEGALHFHKIYTSMPGKVTGFVVKEKGHFPNPTAEFPVFKLLDADFPMPK